MQTIIQQIVSAALAVECDTSVIYEWMSSVPIRRLGSRTAMEVIDAGEGHLVVELLVEMAELDRVDSCRIA